MWALKVASFLLLCISTSSSDITSRLSEMIKKDFYDCEIVFVRAITDVHVESFLPFAYDFLSGGNYVAERKQENHTITFRRLDDVHRFNNIQCALVIIQLGFENSNSLSEWLFDTVTPRYVPIARKDEDAFVFVSESEKLLRNVLASQQFANRIKFKFGVVQGPKPILLSVHLFSNGGGPAVKSSSIHDLSHWDKQSFFSDNTRNLHSKIIKVAIPRAPSAYEMEKNPNGPGYRPLRGLYKIWIDELMEKFNFSIVLQPSSSWSTGKKLKNGTWIGAVGDIMKGDADMAPFNGHIYIRHPFVDWSVPLNYEWLVFITHKPRAFYNPSAMFRPFPIILWVGFFISMVGIFITMKLIGNTLQLKYSFAQEMLYYSSSFLEEGSTHYLTVENVVSARTLITFWMSFALILSTCYKGKLVSLIAFPEHSWVPTTLDELAFSPFRVGLNVLGKGGSAYALLSTSTSPSYRSLFERMEIYPDASVCLKEALTNDIGCLMWQSVADYTAAKNFTDKFGRSPFVASTQTAAFHEDGCIWEKRALFAKKFNTFTWSVVETGIITFWTETDLTDLKKKRLDRERIKHPNARPVLSEEESSNLRLEHLMGIIYVSTFSSTCALITFVGELVFARYYLSMHAWRLRVAHIV